MAEETKSPSPSSSGKSAKSAKSAPRMGGPTDDGLAPTQGSYEPPGPPEETPGTPEHLGSDRPYEGAVPDEVNPT